MSVSIVAAGVRVLSLRYSVMRSLVKLARYALFGNKNWERLGYVVGVAHFDKVRFVVTHLWVFLTGVQDVYDLDPFTANPVDKHIVGVGYELAGAWYPSDGVQVGMFGQWKRGRL